MKTNPFITFALLGLLGVGAFAVTAGVAGRFLDPYTPARLVAVSAVEFIHQSAAALAALYLDPELVVREQLHFLHLAVDKILKIT